MADELNVSINLRPWIHFELFGTAETFYPDAALVLKQNFMNWAGAITRIIIHNRRKYSVPRNAGNTAQVNKAFLQNAAEYLDEVTKYILLRGVELRCWKKRKSTNLGPTFKWKY